MYRYLLGAIALAGLTACTSGDVVRRMPPEGYLQDAPAQVAAADWSQAQTVEVALSEYTFTPSTLTFEAGRPYRLLIHNTGSSAHTFTSRGFFQAIAAQKLVSDAGEVKLPYIEDIEIPSDSTKELYFVPVRAGGFPLKCSMFLHADFGMTGDINVR